MERYFKFHWKKMIEDKPRKKTFNSRISRWKLEFHLHVFLYRKFLRYLTASKRRQRPKRMNDPNRFTDGDQSTCICSCYLKRFVVMWARDKHENPPPACNEGCSFRAKNKKLDDSQNHYSVEIRIKIFSLFECLNASILFSDVHWLSLINIFKCS